MTAYTYRARGCETFLKQAEAEMLLGTGAEIVVSRRAGRETGQARLVPGCFYFVEQVNGRPVKRVPHRTPHAAIEAAKRALRANAAAALTDPGGAGAG